VDVSIESSLSRRMGPHIHGIDDRISCRFWATGNDSESEPEPEPEAVVEDQHDPPSNVSVVDHHSSMGFCKVHDTSKWTKV
jgi:hypothetical protein